MAFEETFHLIVFLLIGVVLLLGIMGALGLAQFSRRVPKTHPINRQMGFGVLLFSLGLLGVVTSMWTENISPLLKISALIFGLFVLVIGRRKTQQAVAELTNYPTA